MAEEQVEAKAVMPEVKVKETIELLLGIMAIAKILAVQFKDGMQASDAIEIMKKVMTPELEKLIVDAYNGADKVGFELKQLSFFDLMDLLKIVGPSILETFTELSKVNKA